MDPAIARQLEGLRPDPEGMVSQGGFYRISPTESVAVRHTRTAVEEYNKLNGNQNLRFVSIVKGKRRQTRGRVYEVVITATDAAAPSPSQLNYYHLDLWIWEGRRPECKIVVLIGSAASADDISRDIARVAKEVHIASRSAQINEIGKIPGHDNIWLHSMIKSVHGDGTVAFGDGDKIFADIILHCTGYKFHFPFLETNNAITVEDNRVGPLYQHVFPPTLVPWLSFVGLPWKVVPFPQFELQSKWIAGVLSGRIRMESTEEMTADVEAFYASLEAAGIPKRYTHQMGESQFEYDNWLAEKSNSPLIEEWREGMYFVTGRRKMSSPETYRDQWEDEDLMSLAYQDFKLCNLSL